LQVIWIVTASQCYRVYVVDVISATSRLVGEFDFAYSALSTLLFKQVDDVFGGVPSWRPLNLMVTHCFRARGIALPRFTVNDWIDVSSFDPERPSDGYSRLTRTESHTNRVRKRLGEFGKVALAAMFSHPLFPGIPHILFVGAEEEMVRPNARRIIPTGTVVTDLKSIWDWTVSQSPGAPMSQQRNRLTVNSTAEDPIAVFMPLPGPEPASIAGKLDYVGPEEFSDRAAGFIVPFTLQRAEDASCTSPMVKLLAALLARINHTCPSRSTSAGITAESLSTRTGVIDFETEGLAANRTICDAISGHPRNLNFLSCSWGRLVSAGRSFFRIAPRGEVCYL